MFSLPVICDNTEVLTLCNIVKWDHPKALYFLVVMCSISAAVQGMDESVTNGANLFCEFLYSIRRDRSSVASFEPSLSVATSRGLLFQPLLTFSRYTGAPQFGLDTNPATAGAAASNNQWLLGLTAGAPYVRSRTFLLFLLKVDADAIHLSSFAALSWDAGSQLLSTTGSAVVAPSSSPPPSRPSLASGALAPTPGNTCLYHVSF